MKLYDSVLVSVKGVLMGAADVIPGVSGGTMAFITGIYDRLISAINSVDLEVFKLFFTGKFKKSFKRIDFEFIIPLVIGVFLSVFTLAKLITTLLKNYPVEIWSFFFGLIAASIFVIMKDIKKWNVTIVTALISGTIGAWFIVGMIPLSTPTNWWFTIIAGAVAIVAMVLPGISGSFILVLMSQYRRILESVKNLDFETLGFFYLGTMIGIIGFSRLLGWMLNKYRELTLAILSGFMIGSLRKVWPFKETLQTKIINGKSIIVNEKNILPAGFNKELMYSILLFLLGIAIVIFIEYISSRKKVETK